MKIAAVDRVAALAPVPPERLEHAIQRLQGHIDRHLMERERIRLALRVLLTEPIAAALPMLLEHARLMNPDVTA